MNRTELQKLIDVCRTDADLQLPECELLAEQIHTDPTVRRAWENSQRTDAAIREAIRDVAVPEGLEQKLLASLFGEASSAGGESTATAVSVAADVELADAASPAVFAEVDAPVPPSRTRQTAAGSWRVWTASLATVAAIVLLTFALWPPREPSLATEEEARDRVAELMNQLDEDWKTSNPPLARYPLPRQLTRPPYRWQDVSGGRGELRVVCYDLVPQGQKARLFVARTQQKTSRLLAQPPTRTYPQQGGGWWIAVWRSPESESIVYLLAVQGGDAQYQNLIQPRSNIAAAATKAGKLDPARKV